MVVQIIGADPQEKIKEHVNPASRVSTSEVLTIASRLSDEMINTLVDQYLSGATIRELAARYEISPSSVKRLLRKYGARKYA